MADKPTERAKPLPYYRWYVQDYRASRNANRLTWQERGIYRELLDECWTEGSIPNDIERLADIARCPVSVMRKAWENLRTLFYSLPGDDTLYVNRRMEIERSADDKERVRKANAGRKGGLAKANNGKQSLAPLSTAKQDSAPASKQLEHLEQSKSSYALGAMSPLGGLAPARCPWCHSEDGHAPDCRPTRIAGPVQ